MNNNKKALELLRRVEKVLPASSLLLDIREFLTSFNSKPLTTVKPIPIEIEDLEDDVGHFLEEVSTPRRTLLQLRILVARTKRLLLTHQSTAAQERLTNTLTVLSNWHRKIANSQGYVFGMSSKHIAYGKTWKSLEDAYIFLTLGLDAWDYLLDNMFDVPLKNDVIDLAWFSQTFFHKVCMVNNLQFIEPYQKNLRSQILEAADNGFITLPSSRTTEIQGLIGKLNSKKDIVTQSKSLLDTTQALEILKVSLENCINARDLPNIVSNTEELLSLGIPPSDIYLRNTLAPFLDDLSNISNGSTKFQNLLGYLREQDHKPMNDTVEVIDEEYERVRNEVRTFSRSKVMLVVGGRTDANSTRGYLKELELKEVLWPGFEKNDQGDVYDVHVTKADIVIRIVKFARTWTKSVIEDAASQGKMTVALQAGYNARQVVMAFYEQVVSKEILANIPN